MGLPNFCYYYWAANIHCLTFWYNFYLKSDGPEWTSMEFTSCYNTSLPALLGSPLPSQLLKSLTNPIVHQSLKVWAQFRKTFHFEDFSLLSPIASNHMFTPSQGDLAFKEWYRSGIKCFKDMFQDKRFMSFDQLSEKYALPRTHFFRYLQIRHYVSSILPCFPDEPSANPIDSFLSYNLLSRGAFSTLYRNILLLSTSPLDRIKSAWEHDLSCSIPEEQWDEIMSSIHKSSLCARHCLIQFKVVHRAHLSKTKLSTMYPNITPTCDKCSTNDATLIHSYWLCPRLQYFWREVFETI